jgi:FkbM family methyltransferase
MKSGAKLSIDDEEGLLKSVQSVQGFVGIIPLRCRLGEYYFLNLDDDHVAEHLFWLGCFGYERSSAALFTHLAIEADYVLDLGSYSGYFSVLSSVLANNSNTFAVEANPLNFHRLCENLRINGSDAVPYHCALTPSTDTQETIKIFYDANLRVLDTGSFAPHELAEIIPQKRNKRNSFIVPAIPFPSLMKELSVPVSTKNESYALIKLDVEGLEAPLLSDIAEFFSNSKFIVLIEILTVEAYKSILSVVHSQHDLSIAYINEHKQEISLCDHSEYSRQKGSRNFILGSKNLMQNICDVSPGKLLEKFE